MSAPASYLALEARALPKGAFVVTAVFGVAAVAFSHVMIPRMPEVAIRFMEQAFRVDGLGAVMTVNDLMAVYFAAFFAGATALLRAIVEAREEHRLEILLAKPISASRLLGARALPPIVGALAIAVVIALACAVAVLPWARPGLTFSGVLGAGLFLGAFVALQLGILTALCARMADGVHALLVASVLWFVPVIPSAALMYRPDLLEGGRADALALASLVWHDATSAWLGPLALVAAIPLALACVSVAGWRVDRGDAI